ncbi:immunoglobulin domain-containing protein, partial [Flavobacterium limi]
MQKLYFFVLLFFLFIAGNKITAQTFQYDWTNAHGEGVSTPYTGSCWASSYTYPCTQYDSPQYNLKKLASDQSNNIFLAGRTNRPFDINSGTGTNMITPSTYLYNSGYGASTLYHHASFIAKHDKNSVLQWAGNIKAPTSSDYADIISIIPMDGNNLLVAGNFYGTVNFDINGTNSQLRTTIGSYDVFFAKYNSLNGDLIWVKTMGGTNQDYLTDLKTDSLNNIILAGYTYSTNLDIDAGAGVSLINTAGGQGSFIIKYDANGNLISSLERVSTTNNTKIGIDSGNNIYELSSFSGTRDLNGTAGTTNFTANGTHTFVSKYSSSGSYLWTREIKRDNNASTSSNPVDFVVKNDHLYFILLASSSIVDVDPNPSAEALLSTGGYGKTCIVEWDSNGNYLWSLIHTGNFSTNIEHIDVNTQGQISYIEKSYTGYDLDPASSVMNVTGNAYWAKLNADHSLNFVAALNFPSSKVFNDIIYDNHGSIIFGGNSATASANLNTFNLSENSYSTQNVGEQNYFITKYLLDCPTPAPSATATQPFCSAATVANLSATGTAIKWYDAAASGAQLLPTSALVNGTKYYASQTLNGCESVLRTEVTAVINTTAAPTASATQPFCSAATVASLSATGTAIKWYDAAASGAQLLPTAALVNGTKYYASQTLNGCESILRTEVTAVINTTAAPTATATQPFCNAATVANLSAMGTAIKWYDAAASGAQLLPTAALVNGTKYYASQTLNGCESALRTEVTAVINTTAAPS